MYDDDDDDDDDRGDEEPGYAMMWMYMKISIFKIVLFFFIFEK